MMGSSMRCTTRLTLDEALCTTFRLSFTAPIWSMNVALRSSSVPDDEPELNPGEAVVLGAEATDPLSASIRMSCTAPRDFNTCLF